MDKRIKTLVNMLNDKQLKIYLDNDNNIIIDGNVTVYDTDLDHFPVKIHKINGNLCWYGNIDGMKKGTLASMLNFPDIVTGNVYIFKNPNLKSLKYCPSEIGGSLICDHCNISDISGLSKKIGKHFNASYNPISDISIIEKVFIGGNIHLIKTKWADSKDVKGIKPMNDSSIIIFDNTSSIY